MWNYNVFDISLLKNFTLLVLRYLFAVSHSAILDDMVVPGVKVIRNTGKHHLMLHYIFPLASDYYILLKLALAQQFEYARYLVDVFHQAHPNQRWEGREKLFVWRYADYGQSLNVSIELSCPDFLLFLFDLSHAQQAVPWIVVTFYSFGYLPVHLIQWKVAVSFMISWETYRFLWNHI